MAEMSPFNLKRLKEEQERALIQTDNQLEQWNQFRSDYVALRDRLKTLPEKTVHNVMVPFGSLAFMPGQLVHTNEILVLLGDNYFVERSAVQAADIITRRLNKLDENIQDLQKQREMLAPRAQFTSEMIQMASGTAEQQEIVEEYDEEKERQWRERHRECLRRAGEKQAKEKAEQEDRKKMKTVKTDADYWDILDRLEQQENERQELENIEEEQLGVQPQSEQKQSESADDTARFVKHDEDSSSQDESEETENEEGDVTDDEEEEDFEHSRRKITFSHTKQEGYPSSAGPAAGSTDEEFLINSPADLYRLVKMAPKSILKTPSKGTANHSQGGDCLAKDEQEKKVTFVGEQSGGRSVHGVKTLPGEKIKVGDASAVDEERLPGSLSRKPHVQAFTDSVVERETTPLCVQQPENTTSCPASQPDSSTSSSRPMSKFRAAKQKTETVSHDSQEQMDLHVSGAALQGSDVSSARPVSKFRASRMKQGGGS